MKKSTDELSRRRAAISPRQLGLPIEPTAVTPPAARVVRLSARPVPQPAPTRSVVDAEITSVPIVMLRLPDVCRLTRLCRSSIYQLEAEPRFPQSVNIGPRAVASVASEVQKSLRERMASRQAMPARKIQAFSCDATSKA